MKFDKSSSKISRDLDADEEHTHDVSKNNRRNTSRSVRDLNGFSSVTIQSEIQKNDSDSTENEHESRGEPFNDVLSVNASRHENDGSYGSGVRILRGPNPWGLDDDVVYDSGDDHEVGEEDEGEDGV